METKKRVGTLPEITEYDNGNIVTVWLDDNNEINKTVHDGSFSPSYQPDKNYLKLTATAANSSVRISSELTTKPNIEVSEDNGRTWTECTFTNNKTKTFNLSSIGYFILLRGDNENGFASVDNQNLDYKYTTFEMTGGIAASGDLNTLVDKNGGEDVVLPEYCFDRLFKDCTSLVQAPSLPSKSLSRGCYTCLFYGCTNLEQAPALPATSLAEYCYDSMFYGCESIVDAPTLSATTMRAACYVSMFTNCTSLEQPPALPSTNLATECYVAMFSGCTSLEKAPNLLATELANGCYRNIFERCTFDMSDNGETFNFDFGVTPPVTLDVTLSSYYDIANWMGNTNGFTQPVEIE